MTETNGPAQQPRQLTELTDVHDFLNEVGSDPGCGFPVARSSTWSSC
ncbi:hypothetical protein [Streptomyces pseudogriseolus]